MEILVSSCAMTTEPTTLISVQLARMHSSADGGSLTEATVVELRACKLGHFRPFATRLTTMNSSCFVGTKFGDLQ